MKTQPNTAQSEPDTKLLSAAPDLLEAAKEALHEIEMWFRNGELANSRRMLRNAIAKAEGR